MSPEGKVRTGRAGASGASRGAERPPLRRTVERLQEAVAQAEASNVRLRAELSLTAARLAESDERFRSVLEQSVDVAYRRNLKTGCFDYLSPAILGTSGFTVEEFSHMSSAALRARLHPDDRGVSGSLLGAFGKGRCGAPAPQPSEYRWRCKEGGYRWISDTGLTVAGPDGKPLYLVGVARDVTERKRLSEALLRVNEELENKVAERTARLRFLVSERSLTEQQELKRLSDFLHDDLQQVLVAARLRSEQLVKEQADGPLKREVRQLRNLVVEALDKTRTVSKELVSPLLALLGIVPALRQLKDQMGKRHGLQVELDAQELPDLLSEALRTELFNAVRELLLNVVKHADTDKASVSVRFSDGQARITVADAGKGFDPGAVLTGRMQESGCGLYGISERMAALGGRLSAQSVPGYGSRMTLSVPVSAGQERLPLLRAGQAGGGAESVARARVLVADDHYVVRRGIVAFLNNDPALSVVGQASSGREACDLTRRLRPDVVIMDVQMPDMDGIEATRVIKAEFPATIVVGVSAFCEAGFRVAMLDAGAVTILDKVRAADNLSPAIAHYLAERDTV